MRTPPVAIAFTEPIAERLAGRLAFGVACAEPEPLTSLRTPCGRCKGDVTVLPRPSEAALVRCLTTPTRLAAYGRRECVLGGWRIF